MKLYKMLFYEKKHKDIHIHAETKKNYIFCKCNQPFVKIVSNVSLTIV